jgi:adenylate kinase
MSVTVFVAGVHGAGKSTVCRELARLLGASHATAGDLIRANANATAEVTVGVKAVPDVDANQELLLRGLAMHRAASTAPLLLDGHFVLLKPDGTIAEIPVTVYETIAPVAVLLVEADPVTIHSRLLKRDKTAPPVTTIADLATQERAHAERVSGELKIPLWPVLGDGAANQAAVEAASRIRAVLENQNSAQ